jgi:hypothetical protein
MEPNVLLFLKQRGVVTDPTKYASFHEIMTGLGGTIFEQIADQVAENIAIDNGWLPNTVADIANCLSKLKQPENGLTPEEIAVVDAMVATASNPTMGGILSITPLLIGIEENRPLVSLLTEINLFMQTWLLIEDPDMDGDITIDEVADSVFNLMVAMRNITSYGMDRREEGGEETERSEGRR